MTTTLHLVAETKADTESQPKAIRLADEFIDRYRARINREMFQAGLRDILIAFAQKKVGGHVTMFTFAGEAQGQPRADFDLVTDLLAAAFDEVSLLEFSDADERSVQQDVAAQKIVFAEKSKGNTITYIEALRRVEMASAASPSPVDSDSERLHLAAEAEIASAWAGRGEKMDYATAVHLAAEKQEAAIHPPDVDPESRELDLAAQAEIEGAWKSKGERIPYLAAVRLAETKRSNR